MTVHLLNAAVMPHEGCYEIKAISPEEFSQGVWEASDSGMLKHYIGYQNTLEVVETLTGVPLGSINVEQTEMKDGDIFYIARLRRRVSPSAKRLATRNDADPLEVDDFDFFKGSFRWEK